MKESGIKRIEYSSKFLKSLKKLPERIIENAERKEKIFREDLFDLRLKTHKLSGKNKRCWSFWIDNSYRIKFVFLSKRVVLFLDIGLHDIYK